MNAKKATARKPRSPESTPGELELEMPKLQRNTLNEEVYEQLKHALMTGRIAPGSTMTIRSLAKSFGISPMPVREALRRLVAEHVLVLLPNRSVSLPIITRERFREITRIRTSLEGLAAEEATPLIAADTVRRMAALNDEMELPGQTKRPEYLSKNREFHFCLYQSSRLPTLVQYDPVARYFETHAGTLLFTGDNGVPLIRYHIADEGGLIPYREMIEYCADLGFAPLPGPELPFVYVFGRSLFTVSFFGANVYPENVTVALERPEVSPAAM